MRFDNINYANKECTNSFSCILSFIFLLLCLFIKNFNASLILSGFQAFVDHCVLTSGQQVCLLLSFFWITSFLPPISLFLIYIYIYIYIGSFSKNGEFYLRSLVIRITVQNLIFFKEINSDGSFHVSKKLSEWPSLLFVGPRIFNHVISEAAKYSRFKIFNWRCSCRLIIFNN